MQRCAKRRSFGWKRIGGIGGVGDCQERKSLALCAKSSLTINSSILEGGANAVLEAMTMGVPVLASRIEGNVGLLGDDYPGYFEEGGMAKALGAIVDQRVDLDEWSRLSADRLPVVLSGERIRVMA